MDERTQEEIDWEKDFTEHREALIKHEGVLTAEKATLDHNEKMVLKPSAVASRLKLLLRECIAIWAEIRTNRRRQISNEALTKHLAMELDGLHEQKLKTESQITTALERLDQFVKTYTPALEELESERQQRRKVKEIGR